MTVCTKIKVFIPRRLGGQNLKIIEINRLMLKNNMVHTVENCFVLQHKPVYLNSLTGLLCLLRHETFDSWNPGHFSQNGNYFSRWPLFSPCDHYFLSFRMSTFFFTQAETFQWFILLWQCLFRWTVFSTEPRTQLIFKNQRSMALEVAKSCL